MSSGGRAGSAHPVATFVLIPGRRLRLPGTGTSSSPELRAAGHDVVAVDLPCDGRLRPGSPSTPTPSCAAIGDRAGRGDLVVVGHSMGGADRAAGDRPGVPVAPPRAGGGDDAAPGRVGVPSGGPTPASGGGPPAGRRRRRGGAWTTRRRCSCTTSRPTSWRPSDAPPARAVGPAVRRTRGRWLPGPTCRPGSCSVATTAASRPSSNAGSCASASGSCPTRWTAATSRRWPIPRAVPSPAGVRRRGRPVVELAACREGTWRSGWGRRRRRCWRRSTASSGRWRRGRSRPTTSGGGGSTRRPTTAG